MSLDLSEVALDPDLGQCFQILRQNPGAQASGGFVEGQVDTIQAFGIVTIADADALKQVPEGDRVEGSLQIITNMPIYETLESRSATSDMVVWLGENYRVQSVALWKMWGYRSAIVVRTKGA